MSAARSHFAAAVVFAALAVASTVASADVQHVIGRGQTIDSIAHRYHVTAKAIVDANGLKDSKHLKPGDTLTIPGVNAQAPVPATASRRAGANATHTTAHAGQTPNTIAPAARAHGPSYEERPKQPDVVHLVRPGEEVTVRVKDRHGKIPPPAMRSFERMMRSGTVQHAVDARLVALLGMVSNHFGGRKLEIVSGFRPFQSTQYTPHSNHNSGKALDFRVQGVPNEVLRDFCKGLRNVGVGYYPNSTFVHLDVREAPTFWVDYSRPGEPPRYDRPNPNADEGTSDVPEEAHDASAPAAPTGGDPYVSAPSGAAPSPAAPAPNPPAPPRSAPPPTPPALPPAPAAAR